MSQNENRVRNIQNLVQNAERELRKAQSMLEAMLREPKNEFEDVPGTLGVYNGTQMVCADGKVFDVNPNYAAKSMLVVGDNLKMIEEEGKQIFKQISKVDRKKLAGILNKKEGSWYALTDMGSYKLLDAAVEFRRGQVNDEVEVLIPEGSPNIEFAALEKLAKEDTRPVIDEEKAAKYMAEKAMASSDHNFKSEYVSHGVTPRNENVPVSQSKPRTVSENPVKSESTPEKPRAPRAAKTEATRATAPRSTAARAESPVASPSRSATSQGPRSTSSRSTREAPARSSSTPRTTSSSPRSQEAPRRAVEESRMPEAPQTRAPSVQSIVEDDDLV